MEEKGEKEVMDATAYICKLRNSFEINFLKGWKIQENEKWRFLCLQGKMVINGDKRRQSKCI